MSGSGSASLELAPPPVPPASKKPLSGGRIGALPGEEESNTDRVQRALLANGSASLPGGFAFASGGAAAAEAHRSAPRLPSISTTTYKQNYAGGSPLPALGPRSRAKTPR